MITCCVCGTSKPDGVRWIDVAGGDKVCSVECEQRRLLKFVDYISHFKEVFNLETSFKSGDIIKYCGEEFEVIENRGDRGKVRENFKDGVIIDPFYWDYQGEKCIILRRKESEDKIWIEEI